MTSVLALAGCAGGSGGDGKGDASTDKSEVTLWMFPVIPDETASQDYWAGVEEDFEAEHGNIDLTIELLPWADRDAKIATAIAGNTGPDLVLLTADQTLNYYSTGGLKPIGEVIGDDKDLYYSGPLDAVTYGGKIYGVPIYQTSTTSVYNKALFEAAGVSELPTTWEEVKAAAPKLAANGVAVLDYSGGMTLNLSFYQLLWQAGGTVFTKDGKDVAFDGPAGVAALQFLLDLQSVGGIPADAAVKGNAVEGGPLGNGTAAMGFALSSAQVGKFKTAVGEENVAVGAPLMGPEAQASLASPGVLALTTVSEDPEAAYAVAGYLASPDVAHALNVASGTYPARTDTPPPGDDPMTRQFIDALEFGHPGVVVPNARQVMAALTPHIQAALLGDKTAQEALDEAAVEARDLIARAG